jgi:hypothetical protein
MGKRAERIALRIIMGCAALLLLAGNGTMGQGPSADTAEIGYRFQQLRDQVDSAAYAARASWAEHVVLSWQLGRGRTPTPAEYRLVTAVAREQGLPRSAVLSAAIAGEAPAPTWAQLREFLDRTGPQDLRITPGMAREAARLEASPGGPARADEAVRLDGAPAPKRSEAVKGSIVYQHYYGYIHAHTSLSDGVGTPDQAFAQARGAGLDFLGITDHGEAMGTLPGDRWNTLRTAADAADDPGAFAALAGFEWSHPTFGHLNVMNTDDFTHALATQSLKVFGQWVVDRPDAFATFNHPGDYDLLGTEFAHLPKVALSFVVPVVGIEVWNRSGDLDDYYYQCLWTSCVDTYMGDANRKRWFLGALGGQDNHDASWGIQNPMRTVVLATELTRAGIVDAYKERRFYVTEDSDLMLEFTADGFPVGSRVQEESGLFRVVACDGGGDQFEEVRFHRDGIVIESRAVSGNCIDTTFDDSATSGFHNYTVIVRQTDDENLDGRNDEAISSPIWTLP